jgi:hypothetical protein
MKIDACRLGLAGAITVTFVCGFFSTMLKLWPMATLKIVGSIHSISGLEVFAPFINISIISIIVGALAHGVFVFALLWVTAMIYNHLQKN